MLQIPKSTLPPRNQRIMRLSDALKAARSTGPAKGSWRRGGFEKIDPAKDLLAAVAGADAAYGLFAMEMIRRDREAIALAVEPHNASLAKIIRETPEPELWGPDDPRDIEAPYGAMWRRIEDSMSAKVSVAEGREQMDANRIETIARETVDEIVADLTDRKGLRHEWDNIDEEIAQEICETWAGFIAGAIRTFQAESTP